MNEAQKIKNIEYWKLSSEEDFAAALAIATHAKKNSHALFFLHLSIEKALYVHTQSDFAPLSHNLLMLAAKSNLKLNETQQELLSIINDFNLQTRYPNEIDDLTKQATTEFTEKYLKLGKEIQVWILEQLKKTC